MKYRRFEGEDAQEVQGKAKQWESQHHEIQVVDRLTSTIDGKHLVMLMYDFQFSTEYDDLLSLIK